MIRRQRLEACSQIANLCIRPADAQAPAVLLQHVDARAAVWRIDHDVDGTARCEHFAQCAQTRIGIGRVVEHAGADDVFEGLVELARSLDGELVHFEVIERMLSLQLLRERDALRADVNADDARARPA